MPNQNLTIENFRGVKKLTVDVLQKNNLPTPASINLVTNKKPRIGIFIMPDNKNAGILENLCLQILEGRNIKNYFDNYLTCFYPEIVL